MFCDQAQYFLLKLLIFNTIWYNYIYLQDIDHKGNQNEAFTTFIEVMGIESNELQIGMNVTLVCITNISNFTQWWTFNGEILTDNSSSNIQMYNNGDQIMTNTFHNMYLHISYLELNQTGNYTCIVTTDLHQTDDTVVLNITIPYRVIAQSSRNVKVKLHGDVLLYCTVEGYPINQNMVRWLTVPNSAEEPTNSELVKQTLLLSNATQITPYNDTVKNISLQLTNVNRRDAVEYICQVVNVNGDHTTILTQSEHILILILDKPQVHIDRVKALGVNTIFLNWTVNDGNDAAHLKYRIQYMEEANDTSTSAWYFYPEEISGQQTRAVLENTVFKKNTVYSLRMEGANEQGVGQKSNVIQVRTLDANPEFIPEVKVTGVTVSSITVSWSPLPAYLVDHIHYYQLKLWPYNSSTPTEAIHSTPGDHLYMFRDLVPATSYEFQVAACNEYTKKCSPWSNVINGTTLDGISDPPENVSLDCRFDNISHTCFVFVSWQPPKNSNGKIIHYNLILEGGASFINDQGITELLTWGPKVTSVSDTYLSTRFYNISANTNYTVKISAVTRMKKHGKHMVLHCTMPPTIPDKNKLSRYSWTQVQELGKWMFKLFLPRISERNGAICCYRVYIIRMESNKGLAELPSAEDLHIVSYHEAHRTAKGGAYVADMFSGENYQPEIFLGDDFTTNYTNSPCIHCTGISSNVHSRYDDINNKKKELNEKKKNVTIEDHPSFYLTTPNSVADIVNNVIDDKSLLRIRRNIRDEFNFILPFDGSLDMNSNYTGFVEVIVYGSNGDEQLHAYSNYFDILNPGPQLVVEPTTQVLGIVVQILCALILIIVILFMALCVLHRYTKQVGHVQGIEMITFRNSFRHLCRSLRGRHRLVSVSPPDMSPIAKSELPNVYMERHRDSDYGFQREFELLPDKFSDRTTRASESRENMYKNRYPDIKAYDQSRAKLTQIDSIAGSDYINANFVIGYKERKKFICAQGPMENTVSDYWRMIWEQHLELILMLTNLEEYSKTKCAKYWPDKTEGEKIFGDITVAHMDETRYSDYIIRHLRVSKKNNNATTGSTTNNKTKDERYLTQYHYLVWKDFMAPEHPHGIIKFIKRVNEAYSLEKGSILVHCSAGVGRTGTLVALDSLLQQLNEEGQVAIFNTVCDLRHQRNFLVQSLKQYIFIYRALMEVAQYGDTEIQVTELKSFFEKMKRNETGKSKMEEDYEKIKNTIEDRKSFTVGSCHENHPKNRSDLVIPYDRNRVILTPIPGSEHSTYINASFIEGYDNSESFIITQDPLETTIADFWRMTSEQGICVIVMLSNLGGDNVIKKCPRYWPDDEITYNHIVVKYIQSESCPYYTRREFLVTNNKSDENIMVTQFQYHGWPTVEGEVPEVTRGLIELVDQTHMVQDQQNYTGPLVIHCSCGSDRSSMFVGLSILVQQLKIEKRVDIFTTARKLRSQRQGMISTFAQYEFLHRAIVNYSDLHQLCEHS